MDRFVARQPIFDESLKVWAYELLFRSSPENFFVETDGDEATSRVIANSFLLFGIDAIAEDGRAFINFTRNLLIKDYAIALPRERVVVEVLETVEPDEEVVAACRKLKKHGFVLALDDFVADSALEPLVDLADIVKVDFMLTDAASQRRLASQLLPRGVRLLAEKIETHEQLHLAKDMGYTLFQGFFFSKPVIISRKEIPGNKLHYLRILKELGKSQVDLKNLARTISQDVSISYKLLRYVNSTAMGLRQQVTSIERAVYLLGEQGSRRWISLAVLTGLGEDRTPELVKTSLIRAKFAELLGVACGREDRRSDYFLMGLFSLVDALLGRPMAEILEELPLAEDVRAGLLGEENLMRAVLDLIAAYEQGDWRSFARRIEALGIDDSEIPAHYCDAVQCQNDLLA